MTRRTSIAVCALPLLFAAVALPAAADSSAKSKRLLAAQTAPGATTLATAAGAAAAGSTATATDSNAELGMIQLQSLMSQRQTAIQTTTNILNAQNDAAKTVINNIGGGCSPNC
jgi:hypothetical protein